MKYGFGVDLGGTTVKLAFFDREGTMLHKWEIPTVTAEGGKQILPDIAAAIMGFLAEKSIDKSEIIGIGIVGAVLSLIVKEYKPVFSVCIGVLTATVIFS